MAKEDDIWQWKKEVIRIGGQIPRSKGYMW
jgi:hypothetical protein